MDDVIKALTEIGEYFIKEAENNHDDTSQEKARYYISVTASAIDRLVEQKERIDKLREIIKRMRYNLEAVILDEDE